MKQKPMLKLQTPDGEKRVLLHSCCAPCSSAIIECLLANDIRPTLFYYNPNIYPQEEYEIRKDEAIRYTRSLGSTSLTAIMTTGSGVAPCRDWKMNPNGGAVACNALHTG